MNKSVTSSDCDFILFNLDFFSTLACSHQHRYTNYKLHTTFDRLPLWRKWFGKFICNLYRKTFKTLIRMTV